MPAGNPLGGCKENIPVKGRVAGQADDFFPKLIVAVRMSRGEDLGGDQSRLDALNIPATTCPKSQAESSRFRMELDKSLD